MVYIQGTKNLGRLNRNLCKVLKMFGNKKNRCALREVRLKTLKSMGTGTADILIVLISKRLKFNNSCKLLSKLYQINVSLSLSFQYPWDYSILGDL